MRRIVWTLALACAITGVGVPAAEAAIVTPVGGLSGPTHGIAVDRIGDVWATEPTVGKVAWIGADGTLKREFDVPGRPLGIAVEPNGTVVVAVRDARRLVRIDYETRELFSQDVSAVAPCGPSAVYAAWGPTVVSYPNDPADAGDCDAPDSPSTLAQSGAVRTDLGPAFDLVSAPGKVFVPDASAGVLRRLASADLATEATWPLPAGASPRAVALGTDGLVWAGGAGPPARVAGDAADGAAAEPVAGAEGAVDGLTQYDGGVMSADAAGHVLRLTGPTGQRGAVAIPDATPQDVATGLAGTFWATDSSQARVLRIVGGPPSPGRFLQFDRGTELVQVGLQTNGWDSDVRVDVITRTGAVLASGGATAAAAAGESLVDVDLGAVPKVNRIYRVTLTNLAGTSVTYPSIVGYYPPTPGTGAGNVPTTLPRAATLRARLRLVARPRGGRTRFRALRLSRLRGDERVTVRCRGARRCPFRQRVVKVRRKGTRDLAGLLGRRRVLRAGTRLTVVVAAPAARTKTIVVTVRRGHAPRVAVRRPG